MSGFVCGQSVLASFSDDDGRQGWFDATVISVDSDSVTVIWDFDYSESRLRYDDVQPLLAEEDETSSDETREPSEDARANAGRQKKTTKEKRSRRTECDREIVKAQVQQGVVVAPHAEERILQRRAASTPVTLSQKASSVGSSSVPQLRRQASLLKPRLQAFEELPNAKLQDNIAVANGLVSKQEDSSRSQPSTKLVNTVPENNSIKPRRKGLPIAPQESAAVPLTIDSKNASVASPQGKNTCACFAFSSGICWKLKRLFCSLPEPVNWSRHVRVCINGNKHGVSVFGELPLSGEGGKGTGKGNNEKASDKGDKSKAQDESAVSSKRLLEKFSESGKLEDALLFRLNSFYQKELETAPTEEMILEYVDYGDQETKDIDGRVEVEKQRGLMFVPLDSGSREDTALKRPHPADRQRIHGLGLVASAGSDEYTVAAMLGRWVSLTTLGDIRMAVCAATSAKGPVRIFVEAYGDDCFQKLQDFVHGVMADFEKSPANASERRRGVDGTSKDVKSAEQEAEEIASRVLVWYTLNDWHQDEQPVLMKRPMYRDGRDYYRKYHESLFFVGKERIMGREYSLVDQFQNRAGNYSVPGVQRKLNFLLHGPPGTGKSKFARALAMYTGRHVVAFTIRQIEYQSQFISMLDDPRQIWVPNDKAELKRADYTFQDLLFVIEEIDVDGDRKVCWQREEKEEISESESEVEVHKSSKRKLVATIEKKKPRLSLDFILRTLDGGCDAPGRMVVMTTNRLHLLDAALMRPGRVKQVLLTFVEHGPFQQMVQHFRRSHASVPARKLWTNQVDAVAQSLLADFHELQDLRTSHLDRRQLGLTPALLEEKCMEAHTLRETFELLADELYIQWARAEKMGEPSAMIDVQVINWQMIMWRQTSLHHVEEHLKWINEGSDGLLQDFAKLWPENEGDSSKETPLLTLAQHMIMDEDHFNKVLEDTVFVSDDVDLVFRAQVEVSADIVASLKQATCSKCDHLLGLVFRALMLELCRKWRRPTECGIQSLMSHFKDGPPSKKLYSRLTRELSFLQPLATRY